MRFLMEKMYSFLELWNILNVLGFTQVTQFPFIHHKVYRKNKYETIVDYTTRLARGLNIVGLMNIQYVISDGNVMSLK